MTPFDRPGKLRLREGKSLAHLQTQVFMISEVIHRRDQFSFPSFHSFIHLSRIYYTDWEAQQPNTTTALNDIE